MGLGKTALYYASHPKARAVKNAQNTVYESSEQQRAYRSKLSILRHKRKLKGDPRDLSHKSNGSIVLENRKANRQRNGQGDNLRLKP